MLIRLVFAGAMALALASPSFAHHPSGAGSAGSTAIVTIPGTTLDQGQSAAAVVFEYLKFDASAMRS
jgi:hypothetical protein